MSRLYENVVSVEMARVAVVLEPSRTRVSWEGSQASPNTSSPPRNGAHQGSPNQSLTRSERGSRSSKAQPVTRSTVDDLSGPHQTYVGMLGKLFPAFTNGEIMAFLKMQHFNRDKTRAQLQSTLAWRASFPRPTIAGVAPFMRARPGALGPDGCTVLLEDMKGGCHRDKLGRPVILSIGMLHGSSLETKRQTAYTWHRLKQYMDDPDEISGVCTVMQCQPCKGAKETFRFPDETITSVFDMNKQHFPFFSFHNMVHICGVPRSIERTFPLARPFMGSEAYNSMNVTQDFSSLHKHLPRSSIPKEMGGDLDFDIEAYIQWRATEEGVEVQPDSFRGFEPVSQRVEAVAKKLLAMSSFQAVNHDPTPPTKHGTVQKQGSQGGLFGFASTGWKTKLLVVGPPGFCIYFNSTDISASTKAAAVIRLDGASVEADLSEEPHAAREGGVGGGVRKRETDGQPLLLKLATATKTYRFGLANREEQRAWLSAFQDAIAVANHLELSLTIHRKNITIFEST